MKYNVEWLFVGLAVFWGIETIMILLNDITIIRPHPFLEIMHPFFFWGICSMLEYQRSNK